MSRAMVRTKIKVSKINNYAYYNIFLLEILLLIENIITLLSTLKMEGGSTKKKESMNERNKTKNKWKRKKCKKKWKNEWISTDFFFFNGKKNQYVY